MSRQLEILALEPFFGGARKNMLETLVHNSRHRWTLLTLPPRRMERRLAAAAHWFAEQIARRAFSPFEMLFTCDALNLADLYRLCPTVAGYPSVVYFHCNRLPDPTNADPGKRLDLTHLNTAMAASQIWFNSLYHSCSFIDAVEGLVAAHSELRSGNLVDDLSAKLRCVAPPVDMAWTQPLVTEMADQRDSNTVFFETTDANMDLLNAALDQLARAKRKVNLLVSGPTDQLVTSFPVTPIAERDLSGKVRALLTAATFVSAKIAAPFDEIAVRAMLLGCRPVLPHTGIYPEIVPSAFYSECLYDMSAEALASQIQEALLTLPMYSTEELTTKLKPFNAASACGFMDDRLDALALTHAAQTADVGKTDRHHHLRRAIPRL